MTDGRCFDWARRGHDLVVVEFKRDRVDASVCDDSAWRIANRLRHREARRPSMNSARELKIATGVRAVGRDMSTVTFLAESEAQALSPSRGSETCMGDSERSRTICERPAGAVRDGRGAPHCTSRRAIATFERTRSRIPHRRRVTTCNQQRLLLPELCRDRGGFVEGGMGGRDRFRRGLSEIGL